MNDDIFNAEEYNRLYKENNYLGMANYLESIKGRVTDPEKQMFIRGQVKALREQAAINDKILQQSTNQDDIDKYNFYQRVISKGIDREQRIDNKYLKLWDEAGTDKAKSFGVVFNRANYNHFLNELGANDETLLSTYNINSSSTNGRYVINFDKSNDKFVEIVNALMSTYNAVRDYVYTKTGPLFGQPLINSSAVTAGYYPGGYYKTLNEQVNEIMPIIAIDKNNKQIKTVNGLNVNPYVELRQMFNIYNDSKDVYNNLIASAEDDEQLYESYISSFMGAAHADLKKLADKGLIDRTEYDGWVEQAKTNYDQLLYQTALSNKEVWQKDVDSKGKEVYKKINDNVARGAIHNYLTNAIDEKRIRYSAGTFGGINGVFVTVGVKPNSNGEVKGEYNKPRSYFIKDLWQDDSEAALKEDTNSYTLLEYNKHLRYGHDYLTDRGGKITGFEPINVDGVKINKFFYTDKDGLTYQVSKDEVLNIIHEDIIFNQGIGLAYSAQAQGFDNKKNVEKFEYTLQQGFLNALKQIYGYQDGDERLLKAFGDLWFPLLSMFNLTDIIHPQANDIEK